MDSRLTPFWPLIEEQAAAYALDPYLIGAMVLVESSGNPNAYNKKSMATGLMQVIPQDLANGNPLHWAYVRPTSAELKDPKTNISWGCNILAWFRNVERGDLKRAVWRYSGGGSWKSFADYEARYWNKVQGLKAELEGTGTVQVRKLDSVHWSERLGRQVEAIIIHTTEGNSSFDGAARYLVSNDRSVSAHELIGDDVVYVMVPDHRAAHHAGAETSTLPTGHRGGEVNLRTYGIETYNTSGKPPSAKAQANLVTRVVEACKRFNLPASKVLAHRELDPTRRSDPTGIDMVTFRSAIAEMLQEQPEDEPNWRAGAWYAEDAMRRAEAAGEPAAAAAIEFILPILYEKRDAA